MPSELQARWEQRVKRAVENRNSWADQFRVGLGRAYFEGQQKPAGVDDSEWISIPKIWAHIRSQLPFLYSIDPYFYVKLRKTHQVELIEIQAANGQLPNQTPLPAESRLSQFERRGKIRQAMLNYLKKELKLKRKARLAIQDAMFAYGVLKARFTSDLKKHPNAGEEILDDQGEPILDPDSGEPQVYPDKQPINKRYEVLRIHPDDFVWDEDAGPLPDSWSWVAQRVKTTKDKAMEDPRFRKIDVQKIQPKKPKREEENTSRWFNFSWMANKAVENPEEDLIHYWEIYDLEKNEWLIMAEDAQDLLVKPDPAPPGIEGHPFSILRFQLRDNSPYPVPLVSPAIDPQREISESRSRWMVHRKRFNRKYEVDVTALDDEEIEIEKLQVGDDGTVIRKNSPTQAIMAVQDAPLDQQGIQELFALDRDFIDAMGTAGNARGVADTDSATEASILDKRLEIREGDELSEVVDWITEFAEKLDLLVQFHLDEEQAVRITGVQGEFWELVTPEDYEEIEGQFEYSVNVGASQPRLPDIERSQWIAFLSQVVIPFPHILAQPNLMKRMAEMFHIEDEAALAELKVLGEQILSGQLPAPGQSGGGPPGGDPVSRILGAALGQTGGNANGGGAPADLQQ